MTIRDIGCPAKPNVGVIVLVRVSQVDAELGVVKALVYVERDGFAPVTIPVSAAFALDQDDVERLRWYLEDYLEWPLDPAPALAARVERRLNELGTELFRAVFQSSDDARDLWGQVRGELPSARFEVVSDVTGAGALPWELLRDPKMDTAVALRAATFVRTQHNPAVWVRLPLATEPVLRVLAVICRPGAGSDVPFRSVAAHLVELAGQNHALDLEVLRPPTFASLAQRLRNAKAAGRPYHVVHFDGHGAYLHTDDFRTAPNDETRAGLWGEGHRGHSPWRYGLLSPPRPGAHGYLLFENPADPSNEQLVDGPALGKILVETGVPVLVLNACRSAHAEASPEPQPDDPAARDVHSRIRAYGSLAQEVVDAGAPGVVAMRYNVWVATAAQFVAQLYAALLGGRSLGEAVTVARKNLAEYPDRAIAFDPRPLEDWIVPVVYEAAPLRLFTSPQRATALTLASGDSQQPTGLPNRPDFGFIGRDETLLALDRAFDTNCITLLHGYAGAGKTSTAAEFARWYSYTGGLTTAPIPSTTTETAAGVVLFTSFERHLPLSQVLDQLVAPFNSLLAAGGIEWINISYSQRRDFAVQLLNLVPTLWIWDNIEPIHGFPTGTPSAWSADEQQELLQFLRDIGTSTRSKAKLLLTSRRDENGWLADLPTRVQLPQMPLRDRVHLAANIVAKYPPHKLIDVEDWRPLLRYSAGNPLTLTILVKQMLRIVSQPPTRTITKGDVEAFINRLQAGEADIDDDQAQGRIASLGASLSYGLGQAFTDADRAGLAILHLFHDAIDVRIVHFMGNSKHGDRPVVSQLTHLTYEQIFDILNRAVDLGILAPSGNGYYTIHPAVPWYFTRLFTAIYGPPDSPGAVNAAHAYAQAEGQFANAYSQFVASGHHEYLARLAAEESNLLHALQVAQKHQWWHELTLLIKGLEQLYHFDRTVEWFRLIDTLIKEFIDLTTDLPLPGREDQWSTFNGFRVELARRRRDWTEEARLLLLGLNKERQAASSPLERDPANLNDEDRRIIKTLGVNLCDYARVLRNQYNRECFAYYREGIDLAHRIDDRQSEAFRTYQLGTAYLHFDDNYLIEAKEAFHQSLILYGDKDPASRALSLGNLGSVELRQHDRAAEADEPANIRVRHLKDALGFYIESLRLIPSNDLEALAVTHGQLGVLFSKAAKYADGYVDKALAHFRQGMQYEHRMGDAHRLGASCIKAAVLLFEAKRIDEAEAWAAAALRNFESLGASAEADVTRVRNFIRQLNQLSTSPGDASKG